MGKIVFLLVLTVGMASPAVAARRVSVEQLEQILAAAHGQSDGKAAKQLTDLELTERASSVRLVRWKMDFPGSRSREALTELADLSAFLDLPAADMPANPPPDKAAQRAMLGRTNDYANSTISRLPNFFATRETAHFEDTLPHQVAEYSSGGQSRAGLRGMGTVNISSQETPYRPLHRIGTSGVTVSYRDGAELTDSQKATVKQGQRAAGLTTSGEFGPVLTGVLQDASLDRMTWGHWEQGASGIEAVYRYTVPAEQSRYKVAVPRGGLIEEEFPAYHGEIAIDPASGEILRITIVADLAAPYEMVMASILVEYGVISIGGTDYICPVRGVALWKMPASAGSAESQGAASQMQTQLNDVAFTGYHLFRAEARIVPADSANEATPSGAK
jgi:hypothetical protein